MEQYLDDIRNEQTLQVESKLDSLSNDPDSGRVPMGMIVAWGTCPDGYAGNHATMVLELDPTTGNLIITYACGSIGMYSDVLPYMPPSYTATEARLLLGMYAPDTWIIEGSL